MENVMFWVIGVIVWIAVFVWNTESYNKTQTPKLKGLFPPILCYWNDFAAYVVGSFLFNVIFLVLAYFEQLPIKVIIGEDFGAGKLLMALIIGVNSELIVNAIRRSKN